MALNGYTPSLLLVGNRERVQEVKNSIAAFDKAEESIAAVVRGLPIHVAESVKEIVTCLTTTPYVAAILLVLTNIRDLEGQPVMQLSNTGVLRKVVLQKRESVSTLDGARFVIDAEEIISYPIIAAVTTKGEMWRGITQQFGILGLPYESNRYFYFLAAIGQGLKDNPIAKELVDTMLAAARIQELFKGDEQFPSQRVSVLSGQEVN